MNKKKNTTKPDSQTIFALQRLAIIIAITVFGVGTLASYIFSNSYESRQLAEYDLRVSEQINALTSFLDGRIASYTQVLRGAAGAVNVEGRENLSAEEWKLFVDTLRSGNKFNEILGIGLVDYVAGDQLDAYQKREGITIRPTGPRSAYSAIRYIEPSNDANNAVIGYDMFSEAVRRRAMINARDKVEASLSGSVVAIQDQQVAGSGNKQSLLMYYPLFSNGVVSVEPDKLEDSLIGFTYLVFRPVDVFGQPDLVERNKLATYEVSDITDPANVEVLYVTKNLNDDDSETTYKDMRINDRTWRIRLQVDRTRSSVFNAITLFALGLLSSAAIAVATYTVLNKRSKIITSELEEQIQTTKDELLALASHQLRTPATGVRQYISMLEKGFFGTLSSEQLEIVTKAYRANERQLEIIDQLLYVAKADAGQLLLSRDSVNMHDLVAGIIEGFAEQLAQKNIKLVTNLRLDTYAYGDERFLSMIVENVLSNAIKYSYSDSKITVKLSRLKGKIKLSVADEGVGIDEEQQEKLFKKFSRIDNPLSRLEGGSGLGLFLAQKLANSHGGKIYVESELTKGAKFIIELPDKKPDSENVVQLTD